MYYSTALECIKELLERSKYDKLMQLVDQENGWTLFEDDKTFPDGVVVIARYVLYGGLKVDVVNPNQSKDDLTSLFELEANKSSWR